MEWKNSVTCFEKQCQVNNERSQLEVRIVDVQLAGLTYIIAVKCMYVNFIHKHSNDH